MGAGKDGLGDANDSFSKVDNFESLLPRVWSVRSETIGYAVVDVLSTATAYTLGAACRVLPRIFSMTMTYDSL